MTTLKVAGAPALPLADARSAFFGAGTYQALSYWAIRRRAFGRIARTKLSQGVGQVVTQVALGLARAGRAGPARSATSSAAWRVAEGWRILACATIPRGG